MQRLLDAHVHDYPGTGIITGIIDNGKTTILKAGSSGTSRPLDEHSLFEIGSVTKTFTATLLADMVLHREVALDDSVQKYLPSDTHVPERKGKAITLLSLATQHSGLPYMPSNMEPSMNPYADYTWAKLSAFLNDYKLTRDPGEQFEYSNLGAALLGEALADDEHAKYAALVQARIFAPLGMTESSALNVAQLDPALRARITTGHRMDGPVTPDWDFDAMAPAGAIRSSVSDMLRFVRCNLGARPLDEVCLLAQQPRDTSFPGSHIGLIWWIGDFVPIVHHGGDTQGYHAAVALSPDHQRGVVVLTNGGGSVDELAQHLIDASLPLPQFAPSLTLAPAQLDAYAGSYHDDRGLRFLIARDASGLTSQLGEQDPLPMYAEGNDTFFTRYVAAHIVFTRDAIGAVSALVLHQNGRTPIFTRDGMIAPPATVVTPSPIVMLDSATLTQYAGRYLRDAGNAYDVTVGGESGLTVQRTGLSSFPIYASSKDHFYYKVIDERIDFVRDDAGNVIALTERVAGRITTMPRVK